MTKDKFLTPRQLGLKTIYYNALIEVMKRLESGEIKRFNKRTCPVGFMMGEEMDGFWVMPKDYFEAWTGICADITGWMAMVITGEKADDITDYNEATHKYDACDRVCKVAMELSTYIDKTHGYDSSFYVLMNGTFANERGEYSIPLKKIEPQHAAKAIRNFLETGWVKWDTVSPELTKLAR